MLATMGAAFFSLFPPLLTSAKQRDLKELHVTRLALGHLYKLRLT